MTRLLLFPIAASLLLACQPESPDEAPTQTQIEEEVEIDVSAKIENGKVKLVLTEPVSEAHACILPIRIENGLNADVNVVMIGFDVTGPGGKTQGNMFAPTATPGESSEARVILSGQGCDGYDTVTVNDHNCSSAGESCLDNLIFVNGDQMRFANIE